MNDLYDGVKSYKLENGAKKHDYSGFTLDHYDSVKAPAAKGSAKGAAPKSGVPAEL